MDLVSVEHDFEYTARDGRLVSIKPRETFILLAKTSAHWWRVCADLHSKPFYVPAEYVKEVPLPSPGPPDPPDPPDPDPDAWRPPTEEGPTTAGEPGDSPPLPPPVARRDNNDNASRDFCRFSTFGFPESLLPDTKPWPPNAQSAPRRRSLTSSSMSGDVAGQTSTSEPPLLLPAPPSPPLQGARRDSLPEPPPTEDQNHQTEPPCGNPQNQTHSPGGGGGGDDNKVIKYTMRRSFHTYETIEDVKCSEEGEEEEEEFPPPPVTSEQSLNHSADSGLSEDCSPESQVEDDVYVNVAELRQRLSSQTDFADPDPHPYPDPSSYPYPDAFLPPDPEEEGEEEEEEEEQGWEVHTDQDSGLDYYYHPATGQTTWDRPVLLAGQGRCPSPHMDPSGPEETSTCFSPQSPTPRSRSRSRSSSAASPPPLANAAPSWSDWEQLVDESSGRPYFYNAMSGETSWEPPQGAPLSPYSQLMRAAEEEEEEEEEGEESPVGRGGGRRRASEEEGPPPLPEEDYPSEDCPAVVADLADLLEDEDSVPVSPALSPLSPTQEYSFIQGVPLSPAVQGSPHSPTQQEYNFSHVTRPTIPRASLDRQAPQGWDLTTEPDGTWVFTSKHSQEQWIKSLDDRGQTYYYLRDGSKSQWNLPEAPGPSSQGKVGNGVEADSLSTAKNWRHTMMGPVSLGSVHEETRFFPGHRRNLSDHGIADHPSSLGQQPPENQQHHVQNLEKAGILNKTKVCEHGKKVRKNWAQSWTVLHGGVLTFHKDPKSANTGASNKTNQIVPEVTVELRGATIGWAARDKSSKKNVIELKSKSGLEFLIQYDNDSIISDWHKVIVDTIRQLEYQDQHSEEEDEFCDKPADRDDRPVGTLDKRKASTSRQSISSHPSSSSSGETDQKKVRTKLIKFLMKRPTMQSLKDKGYIRDNVFGCHLATLCAQERTTVPSFVEKCIKAVEKRGLDIDGLYRVSGNLAVIQKLRYKADHEELDLEDGQWEDVHVITGALKLFFRELPEPLFPYNLFNDFIAAIRTQDYNTKVSYMRQLVRSLPPPNRHTMELLFGHLRKVIECGEDNRMTVQNVAIVFGPTLLRPEMESSNITMHMVFQNQIVEFVLNEYQNIFHSS